MRVFGTGMSHATSPKIGGIFFRGGDVCWPLFGHMLRRPWPKFVVRFYYPYPVFPFLSIRFPGSAGKRKGFYIGFKVYGNDSPQYKNWMSKEDFASGGLAMVLTARFFTDG